MKWSVSFSLLLLLTIDSEAQQNSVTYAPNKPAAGGPPTTNPFFPPNPSATTVISIPFGIKAPPPIPRSTPTPSPANMGITPTTMPEVLQILDNTKTWVPFGSIDPKLHWTSSINIPGINYATQPNIGMQPATTGNVFDNGPLVGTMNTANAAGTAVIFPGGVNEQPANYYFSQTLHWNSHGTLSCQNTDYYQPSTLVFAAGKDGVSFDNGYVAPPGFGSGEGVLDGCRMISLGWGSAVSSDGSNFFDQVTMNGVGAIPGTVWEVGDGVIATSTGSGYLHPRYPNVISVKQGAYIGAVNGQTLTLGSGYSVDMDNNNTLYNYKYAQTATGTWNKGDLTVPLPACWGGGTTELHDASYSPTVFVGVIDSCTGGIATLKNGAAVASLGSTDLINAGVGQALIRLPVELGYNMTSQGPIDLVAGGAWNAGDLTIPYSGDCTGIITGDMLTNGAPLTLGAAVYDYTGVSAPINALYLGTLKSCGSGVLTFNSGIGSASSGLNDSLTLVSSVMLITGGDGTKLNESDYIWTDGFNFGNMVSTNVYGSPANGGTETMEIWGRDDYPHTYGNGWAQTAPWGGQDPRVKPCPYAVVNDCIVGWVTHANGSGRVWKLPAGFHKRVTSDSRNISPSGFFIGYEDVGNGAQGAAGKDWGNYIVGNMIGRVNGGDDIAPNNEFGGMYGNNTIFDIMSMETVPGSSWGTNTNSAESGSAVQSLAGGGHYYLGMYSSDFTWNTPSQSSYDMAANGGITVPPQPGHKNIINGGTGVGDYTPAASGGQINAVSGVTLNQTIFSVNGRNSPGPFRFGNSQGYTVVTVDSPANQSIVYGIQNIAGNWIYNGLSVTDIDHPNAIPANTTVAGMTSPNQLLLSNNLTQSVLTADTLYFWTPSSNVGPCVDITGGFDPEFGITFDTSCQGRGLALTLYGGYNGTGIWGFGDGRGYGASPAIGLDGGTGGGPVFPIGVDIGGRNDLNHRRYLAYDEEFWPPNYHSSGVTALYPFNSSNMRLIVNNCSGQFQQAGAFIIDSDAPAYLFIGIVANNNVCVLTPVLVLNANSLQNSAANMDILTIGSVTINAADFFITYNNIAFPVSTCTGVNVGASVVDTSISGSPAIGTVKSCTNQNVVPLTTRSMVNSVGANDALTATSVIPGSITFNSVPRNGGQGGFIGWVGQYISTPDTEVVGYPFGQISGDVNGYTWPVGTDVTSYNLAALICDATHSVGMNAVITNGATSPTYLQHVTLPGGDGGSRRKVFCDGTAWLYD